MQKKGTRIGAFDVDSACVAPAVNSNDLLFKRDWSGLASRLQDTGYLAFSDFFPVTDVALAVGEVQKLRPSGGGLLSLFKKRNPVGFEVNLHTGKSNLQEHNEDAASVERWKALGNSPCIQQFYDNDRLKRVVRSVLSQYGDVAEPSQLSFQLAWVRCKGKGESTDVHIVRFLSFFAHAASFLSLLLLQDYHHVDPDLAGEDVLYEGTHKSFNVWIRLSPQPTDSSFLALW
jgi:hypothetical protein